MSFFTSFIHNEALAEILIEGHNPHAQRKLETADVDALRQHMLSTEGLCAYVSGRVVGAGRGVWALTGQAVLLRGQRGVQRLPLSEVLSFEAERGRFGHTVRLEAEGRGWSLFGVDRDMARHMHDAMVQRGVASRFDARPARSWNWRDTAPEGWTQDCLRDARHRLAVV